ncbi:MAG TPA: HTH domain-containing protein [Candidatus Pacearchaeota archaeon]|nr:HTH domain-containing protein [Candidatus Pacearchaeota archaeon]
MNFNYQKICINLLEKLSEKNKDIIKKRFGLFEFSEKKTLEAIGKDYNITRERVRQIINENISRLQKDILKYDDVFKYFDNTLKSFGDIKKEDLFIKSLGKEKDYNYILFLLSLKKDFIREQADNDFYAFITKDKDLVNSSRDFVKFSIDAFQKEKKPYTSSDFFKKYKLNIEKIFNKKVGENTIISCFEISRKIAKGLDGLWGLKEWPEINPRGTKEKAYLILKKEGKPLHFKEIYEKIRRTPIESFTKVNISTLHNELIKDPNFILVGRGLYALKDWGYETGFVKDIIYKVLKEENRPLSKEEIVEKVLKQRVVKPNTVILGLRDKRFQKTQDGKFNINLIEES